jgi:hypothetical protein
LAPVVTPESGPNSRSDQPCFPFLLFPPVMYGMMANSMMQATNGLEEETFDHG